MEEIILTEKEKTSINHDFSPEGLMKHTKKRERAISWRKMRHPVITFTFIYYCIDSLYTLFRVYFGIMTALKTYGEFSSNMFGVAMNPQWSNFAVAFQHFYKRVWVKNELGISLPRTVGIYEMMFNTLWYAFWCCITEIGVPVSVAYATRLYDCKFNDVLVNTYWITKYLSLGTNSGSTIELMQRLGIYDNVFLFAVVMRFTFLSFSFILYRAAFGGLGKDYREAAYIDGAGDFRIMWQIMVPMIYPYLSIMIFRNLIDSWDDYTPFLYYMPTHPSLGVGLMEITYYSSETAVSSAGVKLAACYLMSIPVVIAFWFNRSRLIMNFNVGGLKG